MTDVVTIGEVLVSVRQAGQWQIGAEPRLSLAGAEATVAIGLARLGHTVAWCGRVADDALGALIVRTLRGEGVDVSCVQAADGRANGAMFVDEPVPGSPVVAYARTGSAGATLSLPDVVRAVELRPRVVVVSGVTLAIGPGPREAAFHAVWTARKQGATVVFAVNHRRRLWSDDEAKRTLAEIAPLVDVVVGSADEIAMIADQDDPAAAAEGLAAQGVSELVVTRGAGGAESWIGGRPLRMAALPVVAVDPIGAGDAFVAGYVSALLDGAEAADRLAMGNRLGAFAVASRGDWEGLPTRSQLRLIDEGRGDVSR